MPENREAKLVLPNGTEFRGVSFGADVSVTAEVVATTSMIGYPQLLTDPAYQGQIVVLTYPLIGNYGVPDDEVVDGVSTLFESDRVWAKGVVVSDYSAQYSHWNAVKSLGEWLSKQGVPAVYGVDTREIAKLVRQSEITVATLTIDGAAEAKETTIGEAGCKEVTTYGGGRHKIVLVDCGCCNSIIRSILSCDVTLIRVPCDYDFAGIEHDGVILGSGPGDPKEHTKTIENIRKGLERGKPMFGIGLGHQLLAIAAGGETYRLKGGHRSHNHPAIMEGTDRVAITAQNHGYAVDIKTLNDQWEATFTSLNDGSNEGIRHKTKPFSSIQFYPEACSGAVTGNSFFSEFIKSIEKPKTK